MIPLKTIEDLINKHSSLEKDLSSGELDKKLFAEKSKEYSDVNEIVGNAKDYISFQGEKEELEKILNDSSGDEELKKMAELELTELQNAEELLTKGRLSEAFFIARRLAAEGDSKAIELTERIQEMMRNE